MTILIFGGTSSVGKALIKFLEKTDEVITAGRNNCDILLDLKEPLNSFRLPEGVDVVIHTAAQFQTGTDEEILNTEDVNVLGTLKLCQAAQKAKSKHFIFISSIFSTLKSDAVNYNFYSLSKKHAEEALTLYCSIHGLPLTILKPSALYGDGDEFRKHQPFFYTMIDKAEKGEDIPLYGTNDPTRNYLHIDDLTEIILRVSRGRVQGNYTCSYKSDITYLEVAKAAIEAFKSEGKVFFLRDKPDIANYTFEKNYKLYEKIDFYPRISIDEGMKRLAIYRAEKR